MSKRLIGLIVGALAVSLIAGCGGSSGDDSTSSLTKAEFVKRADAICVQKRVQVEAKFAKFFRKYKDTEDNEAARLLLKGARVILIPALQEEAREINALDAPRGEEDEVKEILDIFEEGIKEIENAPASSVTEHPPGFERANKLAKEFGLKTCVVS